MNAYTIPGLHTKKLKYSDIQRIVEDHFDLERYSLLSQRRFQHIVIPRQIAMYFTRQFTPMTLHQIGAAFEKDHASVVYSCRMVKNIIDVNDIYSDDINKIEQLINNHITNRHDGKTIDHPVKHRKGVFQEVSAPLAAGQ